MAEARFVLSTNAAISTRLCYSGGMHFAARSSMTLSLVLSLMSIPIPCANAQENETTSPDREVARRIFEDGERAYEARDYIFAAKAFAEAYKISPHHASLWNCARSWEHAREPARAANAYAKYLRVAPSDAPDRDAAAAALSVLAESLGRIDIYAAEMQTIRVDDELVDETSIYVNPGTHLIEGQSGQTILRRTENLERGAVRAVALVPDKKDEAVPSQSIEPPKLEATAPIASVMEPPKLSIQRKTMNWYGPAAIAAGGVALVSSSLLLWSGLDTLAAREQFDAAPSVDKLEAGKDKQFRTNLFVGATAGSLIATGAFLSLWRWGTTKTNSALTVVPPVAGLPMQLTVVGSF